MILPLHLICLLLLLGLLPVRNWTGSSIHSELETLPAPLAAAADISSSQKFDHSEPQAPCPDETHSFIGSTADRFFFINNQSWSRCHRDGAFCEEFGVPMTNCIHSKKDLSCQEFTVAEKTKEQRGGQRQPQIGDASISPSSARVVGHVSDELIVRFRSYKYAHEHREVLEKSLQGGGWQWIDRVNPASAFPTDFALLKIQEAARASIQEQLKKLSFIKDFASQSRFSRALLREADADNENLKGTGDENSVDESSSELDGGNIIMGRGRQSTSWSAEGDAATYFSRNVSLFHGGRKLLLQRSQITSMFGAEKLWAKGFTGAKVRMAVFDTGVRADHPHFRNIKERTNWTNEDTLNDNLGHGTFVAGVISSQDPQCLGFAPDAEIFAFRVFTDAQVSYTSWFLDAFNYAIATDMNILNLSIGGPDFLDQPFIEKVWEMTANNIIMVSAIGNDGPLYGTLNNPADQSDVIGVGGIDYSDHIASFSSRGMTTWEIPHGYGRVKPDIVAYGRDIFGSKISTGCKSLSGTSVASPVVAGAVCLLASVIPDPLRWDIINPASMKQALIEGAARLSGPNMYEQGAGRLDLLESYEILIKYEPRASIVPMALDFSDCPYTWPFCRQPLYAGAMPVIFNATILNGMGVVGYVESTPLWIPFDQAGDLLDIRFTYSDVIWPWTGYLGLHMQVKDEGASFSGVIEGNVTLSVISPSPKGDQEMLRSFCTLFLRVKVIPTPQRQLRVLWDQFHNVRYPPGYIPRDSLDVRNDILDWHGDHPHTNFHGLFDMLRDAGFYLEILGSPLTCFDASLYGTLLMVDLEDEYHDSEVQKLENDVKLLGLGIIVFADWYHVETMTKMKFFDDNTRSWWTPVTGGANIPALNDLLSPFGIAFGGTILSGPFSISGERGFFASGTDIVKFPAGGFVHRFALQDSTKGIPLSSSLQTALQSQVEAAVLGAVGVEKGRVAVYGDSNCLDSSHVVTNCFWLLQMLLNFTSYDIQDPAIFVPSRQLIAPLSGPRGALPLRRDDIKFSAYSSVLGQDLQCGNDARFEVQGLKGYTMPPTNPPLAFRQRQPMGSSMRDDNPITLPFENASSADPKIDSIRAFDSSDKEVQPIFSKSRGDYAKSGAGFVRKEPFINQIDVGRGRAGRQQHQNTRDSGLGTLGWLNHEELDSSTLLAVQWLIPILLCIAGFVLILGLWRMQQKRPKRVRKIATTARSLLSL